MTKRCTLAALSIAVAALAPQCATAESRTVVLAIPDMYSPACPVLARKALERVEGVQDVQASLERKEAMVVFDDSKTSADKLVEATKHAGFSKARVKGQEGGR